MFLVLCAVLYVRRSPPVIHQWSWEVLFVVWLLGWTWNSVIRGTWNWTAYISSIFSMYNVTVFTFPNFFHVKKTHWSIFQNINPWKSSIFSTVKLPSIFDIIDNFFFIISSIFILYFSMFKILRCLKDPINLIVLYIFINRVLI